MCISAFSAEPCALFWRGDVVAPAFEPCHQILYQFGCGLRKCNDVHFLHTRNPNLHPNCGHLLHNCPKLRKTLYTFWSGATDAAVFTVGFTAILTKE